MTDLMIFISEENEEVASLNAFETKLTVKRKVLKAFVIHLINVFGVFTNYRPLDQFLHYRIYCLFLSYWIF